MKDYKAEFIRIIKFGLVGGMNTLVDYAVFAALTQLLGVYFVIAQIISYACGLANSYFFNSKWTFKADGERNLNVLARFVVVNLAALGVSIGILALCKQLGLSNELLAKLVAIPFSLAVNFIGNRLFVFKN